MDFSSQVVLLFFWLMRVVLGLAVAFGFVVFVVDKWWLKAFNTAEELKKGNYAVAGLIGIVIYAVLRNIG